MQRRTNNNDADSNDDNNNTNENVYSTNIIVRLHPFYLMNADQVGLSSLAGCCHPHPQMPHIIITQPER